MLFHVKRISLEIHFTFKQHIFGKFLLLFGKSFLSSPEMVLLKAFDVISSRFPFNAEKLIIFAILKISSSSICKLYLREKVFSSLDLFTAGTNIEIYEIRSGEAESEKCGTAAYKIEGKSFGSHRKFQICQIFLF